MAKKKQPVGRPKTLTDDVKNLTVRLPKSMHKELNIAAARRTLDTGEKVTVSDIVRMAIELELKSK